MTPATASSRSTGKRSSQRSSNTPVTAHRTRKGAPMSAPQTTLDHRFSDPGAEPTSWAETKQTLDDAQLFWITTVRRDGRPQVTPLVAVWLDDAVYFTTGP